jgi:hypothetical protein
MFRVRWEREALNELATFWTKRTGRSDGPSLRPVTPSINTCAVTR